jgi:hypothetical protein
VEEVVRDIKVGDLVMVVRDCCGKWVGRTFPVGPIKFEDPRNCDYCRSDLSGMAFVGNGWFSKVDGKTHYAMPRQWVKRIPPLSELENEKNKQELEV